MSAGWVELPSPVLRPDVADRLVDVLDAIAADLVGQDGLAAMVEDMGTTPHQLALGHMLDLLTRDESTVVCGGVEYTVGPD